MSNTLYGGQPNFLEIFKAMFHRPDPYEAVYPWHNGELPSSPEKIASMYNYDTTYARGAATTALRMAHDPKTAKYMYTMENEALGAPRHISKFGGPDSLGYKNRNEFNLSHSTVPQGAIDRTRFLFDPRLLDSIGSLAAFTGDKGTGEDTVYYGDRTDQAALIHEMQHAATYNRIPYDSPLFRNPALNEFLSLLTYKKFK